MPEASSCLFTDFGFNKHNIKVIVGKNNTNSFSEFALFPNGGADSVIEAAGSEESFRLAWQAARPNATVTVVAMYDRAQTLPLPDMYGKNLTFKTGGVDGCDAAEILSLIARGKLSATALITHTYPLSRADEAYALFESGADGVMKVALVPSL